MLSKEAVGLFYDHLEERFTAQDIAAETWNKHINANKYWCKFLVKKGIIGSNPGSNPFETVKLKTVFRDPQAMELEEAEKLIAMITPDNGISTKGVKRVEKVDFYRPWLADYLMVSVLIGGRPGEIVNLRWNQVTPNYVALINYKVNHATNETHHRNYVYINPELATILARLTKHQKSEDDYVLVPDTKNRTGLRQFVNKAFKHYWKQVNPDKNLTLNNLRHTYINAILNSIGEEGIPVHNKKETAVRHYLSKKRRQNWEEGKVLFGFDPAILEGKLSH